MKEEVAHILLVEDSDDDALLLRHELRAIERRLEIVHVDSRDDMRAALATRRFDLVITDHHMPGFDSAQAAEELARSGQDAALVIMSGTLSERSGLLAMREGASDFIDKAHRTRLVPVVERELRNMGLRRAKDAVERKLIHLTYHDEVTGLPNRELLGRLLDHRFSQLGRVAKRCALVVVDIDRFFDVHKALGPELADGVLREFGARLGQVAEAAVVARIGQERFAVWADDVPDAAAVPLLASRMAALFEAAFPVGQESVFLHGAVGYCVFPEGASSAGELLANAEHAAYDARDLGPGRIAGHARPSAPADFFSDPLRLESALRHAIEHGELTVHYQPIVDVASGAWKGCEALVRWPHPRHGLIGPQVFIPLAESTGAIGALGRYVLREACRQACTWEAAGGAAPFVAVNVSPLQFRDPGFAEVVREALADSGLAAHRLELELVESELLRDVDETMLTLRDLKQRGVRLSIDDFGTGHSSLSYLPRLPIDVLKIDRAFLAGVTADPCMRAIAQTIVALARTLGLVTIGEGVETQAQLDFLRAAGCELAQGYHVSRPLTADALASFAASRPGP